MIVVETHMDSAKNALKNIIHYKGRSEMDIIETWYFDSQKKLEVVIKGKRVFRRNLKKQSIGYTKVIDGCLKEKTEKRDGAVNSNYCYQISHTEVVEK